MRALFRTFKRLLWVAVTGLSWERFLNVSVTKFKTVWGNGHMEAFRDVATWKLCSNWDINECFIRYLTATSLQGWKRQRLCDFLMQWGFSSSNFNDVTIL